AVGANCRIPASRVMVFSASYSLCAVETFTENRMRNRNSTNE
ncbi:3011_t:CDS:1, partial [Dentiscutata erythropus]